MRTVAAIAGCLLAGVILLEAFETLILARRSNRAFRIPQIFYALTWPPFSAFARRIRSGARRENFLSAYGPVSLLTLIGVWAIGLIVAFALLQWVARSGAHGKGDFATAMYSSASAFFTLGLSGSRIPSSRSLVILEAGLGFSFLGLVISYLPIFYQSYSSRETRISLLDARAGSPPSAADLLVREAGNPGRLEHELEKWESWAAELLQNQLAYPVLAYFRSQHVNQSWLATLVTVLDTSALVSLGSENTLKRQAELTFAMARHVLADFVTVFRT